MSRIVHICRPTCFNLSRDGAIYQVNVVAYLFCTDYNVGSVVNVLVWK